MDKFNFTMIMNIPIFIIMNTEHTYDTVWVHIRSGSPLPIF